MHPDETIDHLETVFETGSLTDESLYHQIRERLDVLGRKLNRFIQSVEQEHLPPGPVTPPRRSSVRISNPVSRIPNRS